MSLVRRVVRLRKVKVNVKNNKDRRRGVKNKRGIAYHASPRYHSASSAKYTQKLRNISRRKKAKINRNLCVLNKYLFYISFDINFIFRCIKKFKLFDIAGTGLARFTPPGRMSQPPRLFQFAFPLFRATSRESMCFFVGR
jgi:hypothetical protein